MPWPWLAIPVLAWLAIGCGSSERSEPPPRAGFSVADGFLRDADQRAVILRGVNLANAHKQSPYFGFHAPADFQRVRDEWGMNGLRFLISWAAIEPSRDVFDEAYLDALAERMDWAQAAGLAVVLDMHQDVYGEGFGGDGAPRWTCDESRYAAFTPTSPWFFNYLDEQVVACFDQFWGSPELRGHYLRAWQRVAARLSDHPAVIGFDPMNEPFWGSTPPSNFEANVLGPFYEEVAAGVRELAPRWVAFLEPSAAKNLGFQLGLAPFAIADSVYAPHAYDTGAEQGQGFDPGAHAALVARIHGLAREASELGGPLWIGEYGGNADHDGIAEYMDAVYAGTGSAAAGSMYWAYDRDDGYGLLRPDGSEKSALLDAVVRPFPMRVAGEPIAYAYDAQSRSFSFSWIPRARGVTEISVPARALASGYRATCEGCELVREPGQLNVTAAPPGQPITLTLEP
jgi:endoglycosylceramidase